MKHTIFFIAGLSNGETAIEGKGAWAVETGGLSPYQRLLSYCREKELTINSLSLGTDDGRRWTLPSAGKRPKLRVLQDAPKPVAYKAFRKAAGEAPIGQPIVISELYSVIEGTYEDGKRLQIWVRDGEGYPSWSIVI